MLERACSEVLRQLLGDGFEDDPNFRTTAARMARAYQELLRGSQDLDKQVAEILSVVFPCTHTDLQVVGPIELFSLCPHHFLPVHLTCAIGYIPNGRVPGLSKIPRVAQLLAARAVLQEQLVADIADTLVLHLQPKGVIVQLVGVHDCMRIRGVRSSDASFISESIRGMFENDPAARAEALGLIRDHARSRSPSL